MARLTARYKHFWATGKFYQRFWANSGDANVGNALLTVTSTVVAGAGSGAANASGFVGVVQSSLIDGAIAISYTNPANTFTVGASLLEGVDSVTEPGVLFNVAVTLTPGNFGQIDVVAPLNTRLNARYRHFWNRRQRIRHFWAQWEGAGIGRTS